MSSRISKDLKSQILFLSSDHTTGREKDGGVSEHRGEQGRSARTCVSLVFYIYLVYFIWMIKRSIYEAHEALPTPKKSFQAFLVDQLDLCVETLANVKRVAKRNGEGSCVLLAVRRLSGPNDLSPSYSLLYEDMELGQIANLDYLLSTILGASLNGDRSGVCVPEPPQEFSTLVADKFNALFGEGNSSNPFVVEWL